MVHGLAQNVLTRRVILKKTNGLTLHRNMPGVYEVHFLGKSIGMIMGDEHYTGEKRKFWRVEVNNMLPNQLSTLREAKEWVGI